MKKAAITLALALTLVIPACQDAPVTGRNQLILMSPEESAQMGKQAYRQILAESEISQDDGLTQRVQRVGTHIAEVVDRNRDFEWEFTLIEDETPNAFALPGGKVGVHTGLFKVVENDAQLAAVLAHEIAHVVVRHSAERISQQMAVQAGLLGLGVASGGDYVRLAQQAATLGVILPFSRKQESEADTVGLLYMAKAGYNPHAAVELWQNFKEAGGERPPQFLSTHPSPESRIEELKAQIPEVMPVYRKNRRS